MLPLHFGIISFLLVSTASIQQQAFSFEIPQELGLSSQDNHSPFKSSSRTSSLTAATWPLSKTKRKPNHTLKMRHFLRESADTQIEGFWVPYFQTYTTVLQPPGIHHYVLLCSFAVIHPPRSSTQNEQNASKIKTLSLHQGERETLELL